LGVFQAYKLSSKPSWRLDRKGRVETRKKETSNKKMKEEIRSQLDKNMEKGHYYCVLEPFTKQ
jgi:hypothetical protein